MLQKIKILERIYYYIFVVLLFSLALTPYIIKSGTLFLEEEYLEVILIIIQMFLGYLAFRLYKKEAENNLKKVQKLQHHRDKLEKQLGDAFKYIGSVNVQMQEIKSIFSGIKKYPESKKDFKLIMHFLADKILGITDIDWVIFKIIDLNNFQTLKEYCGSRGLSVLLKCDISNEDVVGEKSDFYDIFKSDQENFNEKAFCIIPNKKLTNNQKIFIKAIINQLDMMFIIFSSSYYKEVPLKNNK